MNLAPTITEGHSGDNIQFSPDQMLIAAQANKARLSMFNFVQEMWGQVVTDEVEWNWHIPILCAELTKVAQRVARGEESAYDLLVNIPPGTTKSLLFCVFFPAWCWTNWPWMRFIKTSYSAALSLEHAEMCRDLVRSEKYQLWYPYLRIKRDKDIKSNFRITYQDPKTKLWTIGGNVYSTSVGGTVTGYHAHILLVDDPIDPFKAYSEVEMKTANRFVSQTLPTRKVNKLVTPLIMIMQRVMEGDPSDVMLNLKKKGMAVRHICLPGELVTKEDIARVSPPHFVKYYVDGLLDPKRLSRPALKKLELTLGQYGYAGQIQQDSSLPGGGMFDVTKFKIIKYHKIHWATRLVRIVRFWDKAATDGSGDWTVGAKIAQMLNDKYIVLDVIRGQWSTNRRERIIKDTGISDGPNVLQKQEQEPGSGGKDSARHTEIRLQRSGIPIKTAPSIGNKVYRADPWSVRVNDGQVYLLKADWNQEYKDEHRRFSPTCKHDDQVDASSGAYSELFNINRAGIWGKKRRGR